MSLNFGAAKIPWRTLLKLAFVIAFLFAANFLAAWMIDKLDFQIRPSNEDAVHTTIMASAVLYSVLLAIPFVPGAEIGLALIAMLGPPIALLVYVCTIIGLMISFIAGRIMSLKILIKLAEAINFQRMLELLKSIEPLDQQERLAFLASRAPNRFLPFLIRYRYVALAVALNIPGNFLIGGGGGIALFAGISRLYSLPGIMATIAVAVAPVPLAVIVFGNEFLTR